MEEKTKIKELQSQFSDLVDLINQQTNPDGIDRFGTIEKYLNRRSKRKNWLIISGLVLIISIYIGYSQSSDQFLYDIYFFFLVLFRMLLIPILPYWNWFEIHSASCLIGNPFYNSTFDMSECQKCMNITEVSQQSNVSFFNFSKLIYLKDMPSVIDDAMDSWPVMKDFNVEKLFKLYLEDPILSEHDLCHFRSNLRQYHQEGGADRLFEDYLKGARRSFIVQWSNCKRETLKVIRSLVSKPYFLPASIGQTMLDNGFLVSVGFNKGKSRFHEIPSKALWNWVAQIHGRSSVELFPDASCSSVCQKLKRIVLKPGDLLIYSSIYEASYAPLSKETILMVQGFE